MDVKVYAPPAALVDVWHVADVPLADPALVPVWDPRPCRVGPAVWHYAADSVEAALARRRIRRHGAATWLAATGRA